MTNFFLFYLFAISVNALAKDEKKFFNETPGSGYRQEETIGRRVNAKTKDWEERKKLILELIEKEIVNGPWVVDRLINCYFLVPKLTLVQTKYFDDEKGKYRSASYDVITRWSFDKEKGSYRREYPNNDLYISFEAYYSNLALSKGFFNNPDDLQAHYRDTKKWKKINDSGLRGIEQVSEPYVYKRKTDSEYEFENEILASGYYHSAIVTPKKYCPIRFSLSIRTTDPEASRELYKLLYPSFKKMVFSLSAKEIKQ